MAKRRMRDENQEPELEATSVAASDDFGKGGSSEGDGRGGSLTGDELGFPVVVDAEVERLDDFGKGGPEFQAGDDLIDSEADGNNDGDLFIGD